MVPLSGDHTTRHEGTDGSTEAARLQGSQLSQSQTERVQCGSPGWPHRGHRTVSSRTASMFHLGDTSP